jgi:tetratricopeptide (TPR) repeat protein
VLGKALPEGTAALASGVTRDEVLSTQALTIPFVGRRQEMQAALDALLGDEQSDTTGRALVIHGDSGTGKSYFARELMLLMNGSRPDDLFLYIDIANDEYQAARTLSSLLNLALIPGQMKGSLRISIPEHLSLERFRRQTRKRGLGRGLVRGIVQAIATAVGVGAAVGSALGASKDSSAPPVDDELAAYLAWVAKRQAIFLAVDNVQFLNLDVRLTLESVLQRVKKRVQLIAVDRTTDGVSELNPPVRCFSDTLLELTLGRLTRVETAQLVAGAIGATDDIAQSLAEDIYTKTDGLAKDVEYCLRQYSLELGRGAQVGAIEGLLSTINRLPLIHRQFLVIAALLDGGVKQAIARGTVSRLVSAYDRARLDEIVDELVARDYLRLNSQSGDRIRPGHERIVIAIRDLADDELHEEVRRSLVAELAAALDTLSTGESETYLLHCLVGLQTARELARNVHYVARLIQFQHRQDQFPYLVAISEELQEVLPLLPEHALNDLLDAMQKSSAFEQGLQLVAQLDANHVPGAEDRRMYRLKYLTQAYRFDEALSLSKDIGEHEWGAVYRINALMALERDEEAKEITERELSEESSEWQAVLRRNTITLYDTETALRHLNEAEVYFERTQSDFRLATIDTNRSTVYLHAGRYGDALRSLDRAVARMRYVGSREIFQAQVNVAVRYAIVGDYEAALRMLDESAVHVPRALLYDQVLIDIDRIVVRCASGALDKKSGESALAECVARIRGFQMPDLHRLVEINMAALGDAPTTGDVTGDNRVQLIVPLQARGVTWGLETEVHWRY